MDGGNGGTASFAVISLVCDDELFWFRVAPEGMRNAQPGLVFIAGSGFSVGGTAWEVRMDVLILEELARLGSCLASEGLLGWRHVSVVFPAVQGLLSARKSAPVVAVDGVSLSVEKGEILGLVGESGCGKSTLSRTVMLLQKPTEGRIFLEGEELTALSASEVRKRRPDFQMVFQDPYASLNPRFTVYATLKEALQSRRKRTFAQTRDDVAELMEKVGLSPSLMRKYPHEFSGGQRQRVAIARALAPEPRLVIADEPVSALDVSIQSQILNLLIALARDLSLTMIFISHDLSVVHYIADRIAVMRKGRIVEYGEADKVFSSPSHEYTQALLAAVPRL